MGVYHTFENLEIFKLSRELCRQIYLITREDAFSRDYGLKDQIRRSSVSILSNIAEGFERGTRAEFIRFLFIAKDSCGELRAQILIASDQGYIDNNNLRIFLAKSILLSKKISAMITSIRSKNK